jgi:aspartyl-tRNA(Asn)/glutamyl-tRNA(Gln) amidotransferase subunit A
VSELHRLGIRDIQRLFAAGEARPSELVAHLFERIAKVDPRLRSYIELSEAVATASALESDSRYSQAHPRPLEGIPIAIKANIAVRGLELSAGTDARRGLVAEGDAMVVTRLRGAGAIILGSLNMDEAALGATTDNPFFGRCLNPHGEGRTPGGSSGGSGVAVAAGLCIAALGTDTLGSVRIPAAYNGVYGLKPSRTAVPDAGLVPLSKRFDMIGPLARSIDDLELVSSVLFTASSAFSMREARFFRLADFGGVKCEARVAEAFGAVAGAAEMLILPFDVSRIRLAGFALSTRELVGHLVELGAERCSRFSPDLQRLIEFAIMRSEADFAEDERILGAVSAKLLETLGSNGILMTPTTPQTAFLQGERAPLNQADFTALANVAGLPAISLPIGRDDAGMPIGLQLVGPIGGEAMILREAKRIDRMIGGYLPPNRDW